MIKYVYLDDSNIEIGGTNFTSLAILEDRINEVKIIKCPELSKEDILRYKDCVWILGNITGVYNIDTSTVLALTTTIQKFIKIEFDYNYCTYRGEVPHRILGRQNCTCPSIEVIKHVYDWIIEKASLMFFMSHRQMSIYSLHFPKMRFEKCHVLSSCFTRENFSLFEKIRFNPPANNGKWAILQGYGGWHSQAKGVQESIKYCHNNNLNYDVLPIREYEEHITSLSHYYGLVFLPIIDDTCPRCVIESKLIGIQCIVNENCQHIYEDWYCGDVHKAETYLKHRPAFFWGKIDELG
ncbi:MAG: hypothetical protein NWE83_07465 [Candidatus Bathyarchaeota archaeon]|nr:hypothetical protein [Candidatus Bathyarchaeota archaeon]